MADDQLIWARAPPEYDFANSEVSFFRRSILHQTAISIDNKHESLYRYIDPGELNKQNVVRISARVPFYVFLLSKGR